VPTLSLAWGFLTFQLLWKHHSPTPDIQINNRSLKSVNCIFQDLLEKAEIDKLFKQTIRFENKDYNEDNTDQVCIATVSATCFCVRAETISCSFSTSHWWKGALKNPSAIRWIGFGLGGTCHSALKIQIHPGTVISFEGMSCFHS
jgi:hypothetical protein